MSGESALTQIITYEKEAFIRPEIDRWFSELPLYSTNKVSQLLEWDKKLNELVEKIARIQVGKERKSNLHNFIVKWLRSLKFLPGQSVLINEFATDLEKRIKYLEDEIPKDKKIRLTKSKTLTHVSQVKKSHSYKTAHVIDKHEKINKNENAKNGNTQIKSLYEVNQGLKTRTHISKSASNISKSANLIEVIVKEWCDTIQHFFDDEDKKQITNELAVKIVNKINELNNDRHLLNDEVLYDILLDGALEKYISELPRHKSLIRKKDTLKYQLAGRIRVIKPLVREEKTVVRYKNNKKSLPISKKPINNLYKSDVLIQSIADRSDSLKDTSESGADTEAETVKTIKSNRVSNVYVTFSSSSPRARDGDQDNNQNSENRQGNTLTSEDQCGRDCPSGYVNPPLFPDIENDLFWKWHSGPGDPQIPVDSIYEPSFDHGEYESFRDNVILQSSRGPGDFQRRRQEPQYSNSDESIPFCCRPITPPCCRPNPATLNIPEVSPGQSMNQSSFSPPVESSRMYPARIPEVLPGQSMNRLSFSPPAESSRMYPARIPEVSPGQSLNQSSFSPPAESSRIYIYPARIRQGSAGRSMNQSIPPNSGSFAPPVQNSRTDISSPSITEVTPDRSIHIPPPASSRPNSPRTQRSMNVSSHSITGVSQDMQSVPPCCRPITPPCCLPAGTQFTTPAPAPVPVPPSAFVSGMGHFDFPAVRRPPPRYNAATPLSERSAMNRSPPSISEVTEGRSIYIPPQAATGAFSPHDQRSAMEMSSRSISEVTEGRSIHIPQPAFYPRYQGERGINRSLPAYSGPFRPPRQGMNQSMPPLSGPYATRPQSTSMGMISIPEFSGRRSMNRSIPPVSGLFSPRAESTGIDMSPSITEVTPGRSIHIPPPAYTGPFSPRHQRSAMNRSPPSISEVTEGRSIYIPPQAATGAFSPHDQRSAMEMSSRSISEVTEGRSIHIPQPAFYPRYQGERGINRSLPAYSGPFRPSRQGMNQSMPPLSGPFPTRSQSTSMGMTSIPEVSGRRSMNRSIPPVSGPFSPRAGSTGIDMSPSITEVTPGRSIHIPPPAYTGPFSPRHQRSAMDRSPPSISEVTEGRSIYISPPAATEPFSPRHQSSAMDSSPPSISEVSQSMQSVPPFYAPITQPAGQQYVRAASLGPQYVRSTSPGLEYIRRSAPQNLQYISLAGSGALSGRQPAGLQYGRAASLGPQYIRSTSPGPQYMQRSVPQNLQFIGLDVPDAPSSMPPQFAPTTGPQFVQGSPQNTEFFDLLETERSFSMGSPAASIGPQVVQTLVPQNAEYVSVNQSGAAAVQSIGPQTVPVASMGPQPVQAISQQYVNEYPSVVHSASLPDAPVEPIQVSVLVQPPPVEAQPVQPRVVRFQTPQKSASESRPQDGIRNIHDMVEGFDANRPKNAYNAGVQVHSLPPQPQQYLSPLLESGTQTSFRPPFMSSRVSLSSPELQVLRERSRRRRDRDDCLCLSSPRSCGYRPYLMCFDSCDSIEDLLSCYRSRDFCF